MTEAEAVAPPERDEYERTIRALAVEIERLKVDNEQLREQIDTCRELRKYDRIEIERLRLLLDKR